MQRVSSLASSRLIRSHYKAISIKVSFVEKYNRKQKRDAQVSNNLID